MIFAPSLKGIYHTEVLYSHMLGSTPDSVLLKDDLAQHWGSKIYSGIFLLLSGLGSLGEGLRSLGH